MGNFNEQISRMKSLMTYGAVNENKEQRSGSMEYHAVGADGKSYGIIRENAKYYIKVAPQSKEKLAEAYEYIGGFSNRKDYEYNSYSNALKQFELKMMSLNEAYSARVNVETLDPFKKEDVIIEGTKKMKDEIARQRQIMNNVNALMNESSTIKVGNTGVPEAPKTTSFSDKIGEPFNQTATATLDKDLKKTSKKPASMGEPFGDGKKAEQPKDAEYVPQGSVANQKPKGGKVVKVNEDCEKDEWGSCGLPGKEGVGSPEGHLMEDDDIAGIANDNFEANDDDLTDVESAEFEDGNDEDLDGEEALKTDDEDSDEDFDDEGDEDFGDEDDEELGDEEDEPSEEDLEGEDDSEDDDFDFDDDFEDGEDAEDADIDTEMGSDLDDEDDELGDEDDEELGDEDDEELGDEEDEPSEEDFGVEDDELGDDEFEEEFDPEKDAQYDDFDFDAADAEELEDEGDLDDEDFDDEDDEDLDDEDFEDSDDEDFDDEDLDDEDFEDDEDLDDEDLDDEDFEDNEELGDEEDLDDEDFEDSDDEDYGISESRKRELQPIIEKIVSNIKGKKLNESKKKRKPVNEEGTKLNDFGKHPGYRKKPMTLPETGPDTKGQNRDWNDESAHNEQPFGQKIGSSAPFTESPEFKAAVERITEDVMNTLMGKKKR